MAFKKVCECGTEFESEFQSDSVKYESSIVGVYHEGKQLCMWCRSNKYEDAIAEHELINTEKNDRT